MSKFPLNLQFFAEPTDPANTPPPADAPPAAQATPPSADDIASAIFKAAEARTQRAEAGVVKSFADQYGMTEAEARAALDKAKAEKAAKLPEDVQKQIDAAKAEVQKLRLSGAVAKEGAVLGLLDADVAITLIPADAIKTNDKGEITGVKEALEKLKETKPYLFATVQKAATGQRVSGGSAPDGKTAHDEAHEKMYGKK